MSRMLDYEKDPRPDLEGDHVLWVALLTVARERDAACTGLFEALHALRCGGASLVQDKDFGMLIRPGEWDQAEYEAFRTKHLAPRKAEIVAVLCAAASKLPQLEKDTLRARIVARVRAVEVKARALGWTQQDLWAEKDWDDPFDGRRRQSLFKALLSASQTWGDVRIGEVTAEAIEFLVPGPGLSGETHTLVHYRVSPAIRPLLSDAQQSAATKNEEARTA